MSARQATGRYQRQMLASAALIAGWRPFINRWDARRVLHALERRGLIEVQWVKSLYRATPSGRAWHASLPIIGELK